MEQSLRKGLTLIELLVVIAIIGILSAVVIASLNVARLRAANANIQSSLEALRLHIENYYDDNELSYGEETDECYEADTLFTEEITVAHAIKSSVELGDSDIGASCSIDDNGQSWAVSVPFKRPADGSWCVDWTGYVGQGTASEGRCEN